MRKPSLPWLPSRLASASLASACLTLALTASPFAATGQTPTPPAATPPAVLVSPPAPYPDWQSFLTAAFKADGLVGEDLPPWHLKVKFKLFDEQGKAKDEGIFEDYQATPTRFKVSYTSKSFTQSTYGTDRPDRAVLVSGDSLPGGLSGQPWPISVLWGAFVSPLPLPERLSSVDFEGLEKELRAGRTLCVQAKAKPTLETGMKSPVLSSYCFESGTTNLRFSMIPYTDTGTITAYIGTASFQGHSLPVDMQIARGTKVGLTAHLDSIEAVAKIDEKELIPPADARLYPTMRLPRGSDLPPFYDTGRILLPRDASSTSQMIQPGADGTAPNSIQLSESIAKSYLIKQVQPTYPPIAKATRTEGTVILIAHVSKSGAVETLKVASGHPMLQQAALDAVKQWQYKPYLLNGKPVEFTTTLNVIFNLDYGDKPAKLPISAGVAQGQLLKPVPPIYPPDAKAARVSGTVILQATIGKDGLIKDIKLVSGHPMLQQAAIEAVKQWQYKPYLLNGEPVDVETTINVAFNLGSPPKQTQP